MPYLSKQRLHLARDGKTVVLPGDPRSASLLVNEGGIISDEVAKKYGLIDGSGISLTAPPVEEALPLEGQQTPGTNLTLGEGKSVETPPGPVSLPPTNTVPSTAPQYLKFGTPAPAEPVSAGVQIIPEVEPRPEAPLLQPKEDVAPLQTNPALTDDSIPDDFPFKAILAEQGFASRTKLKAATKEQLLELKQIGSERADAIMVASEKL